MPAVDPDPLALVDVDSMLRYLRESDDDDGTTRDLAQELINSYSLAIVNYLGRQLLPAETNVSKDFVYEGNAFLSLAPYEASAITTVTLYTDWPESAWVTLLNQTTTQEAQWKPYPRHKTRWGTYTSLVLPEIGRYNVLVPEPLVNRRARRYQVTVTGDWGVGSVPADVQQACKIAVANAWRNPEDFQTRQLGPLSFTESTDQTPGGDEDGLSIPRSARALLKPYKRKTSAR